MWALYMPYSDSATRSAALALLFTILSQLFFTQQLELLSELFSWAILPTVFKVTEQLEINGQSKQTHGNSDPPSRPSRSLWVLAFFVSLSSLYKAELGLILLYPMLLPMLQAAQVYLRCNASLSICSSQVCAKYVQFSMFSAAFAAVTLSYNAVLNSALSAIAVLMQFSVYMFFLSSDESRFWLLPHVQNFGQIVIHLSKRTLLLMIIAISVQTVVFGFTTDHVIPTMSVAAFKALSWYFIAHAAQQTSWTIAPAIHTTALLCTLNPSHHSSLTRASFFVIASLLALAQVIQTLSKQCRFRNYLWIFSLMTLTPYLTEVCTIRRAISDARLSYSDLINHPVEDMVRMGRREFHDILRRQSENYSAACEEYKRRYSLSPPAGFEDWYNFTVSHESPIIDEFDTIYRSISPFWHLSGKQVTQTMEQAYAEPGSELWLCEFESKNSKTTCRHAWRTFDRHTAVLFNHLLGDLKGVIPDMKFLVNHLDEPRVVTPPLSHEGRTEALNLTNLSRQPTWKEITKSCKTSTYKNDFPNKSVQNTFGLPFVTSRTSSLNLCHHPEYRKMHGLVQSPTSFLLLSGFVPVLSTGALSSMGDILFPSPAYTEEDFLYDESKDIAWDKKKKEIYWAGSTTGGFAVNDAWHSFHRQRFVTLAQGLEHRQYAFLRKREGKLQRIQSSFPITWIFQVAFTRVFQCEAKNCRDQRAHFRTKSWAEKNRPLKSRLAFDLDGNGISGRYYQLLASRSTPLKQTILQEWHDDRLIPWVHYVPISQSMEELPEIASYLMFSETGQQIAQEIAEQGRQWFSGALREVDMSIYIYRLLLELARLQDPMRQPLV